jgi:hypothetical protein
MLDTRAFLEQHNIFDKYEGEYRRRGAHFLLGLKNRINNSNLTNAEKQKMRTEVWKLIKELGLHRHNSIRVLEVIDRDLATRLANKVQEKQKEEKIMKKIIDIVLPKGSNRREAVKILLGKGGNSKSIAETKVTEKKKEVIKQNPKASKNISEQEREKIKALKDKFKGKRCFIIGNGPSLNKCDLSLLENEYTFAVNGIFYKTKEMGFKPTFYMVEDGHVVDDNLEKINAYDP